jgi:hypothetical protein
VPALCQVLLQWLQFVVVCDLRKWPIRDAPALSNVRELAVTFNLERPAGRAEVLSSLTGRQLAANPEGCLAAGSGANASQFEARAC